MRILLSSLFLVHLLQRGSGHPVFEGGDGSAAGSSELICSHRLPSYDSLPAPVQLNKLLDVQDTWHKRAKRSAIEHQMRIKVFYHDSVTDNLTDTQIDIVKNQVVPDAVSYWEDVLKVRRSEGPILLNRKCQNNQYFLAPGDPTQFCRNKCVETKCGEVPVPEEHLKACHTCNSNGRKCGKKTEEGAGVDDVDFVLYVSALSTLQCGQTIGGEASTVAYAAHCQQEADFDRPIAGHTNICPDAIKNTKHDIEGLSSTIKHELLHALGFSSSLFAFFRAGDGSPLTPRGDDGKPPVNQRLQIRQWSDKIIKKVTRPWKVRSGSIDRDFYLVVTPRVVEEVRKHFNCSELEGAELEDQGGEGTSLTHWEKRLFQNEAMTGTVHTQNPVYSRLTFALLEDSGWYIPNYDMAQEITWGRDLGCDFARKSCMELLEDNSDNRYPFCKTIMQSNPRTTCTADLSSVGSCNLALFSDKIPAMYQNFKEVEGVDKKDIEKVGSSVTLADFCPYIQEFTWKTSEDSPERGTRCTNGDNQPKGEGNFALEAYKTGSKCFEQGRQWSQKSCSTLKQWKRFGAGCYPYKCEEGRLHIMVRNVSFPCSSEGQELEVSLLQEDWLHEGSIICPKCSDFCSDCIEENDIMNSGSNPEENLYKENLDDKCNRQGIEGLRGFLENFGIDLG